MRSLNIVFLSIFLMSGALPCSAHDHKKNKSKKQNNGQNNGWNNWGNGWDNDSWWDWGWGGNGGWDDDDNWSRGDNGGRAVSLSLPTIPNVVGVPANAVKGNGGLIVPPGEETFSQTGSTRLESSGGGGSAYGGSGPHRELRLKTPQEALAAAPHQTQDGTMMLGSAPARIDAPPPGQQESAGPYRPLRVDVAAEKPTALRAEGKAGIQAVGVLRKGEPVTYRNFEQLAARQIGRGQNQEALVSTFQALKLNPKSASGFHLRAIAQERLGNRSAALEDLRNAASLDTKLRGRLALAEAGKPFADPSDAELDSLLADVLGEERTKFPVPWMGFFAALAAAFGLGVWSQRKRKDAALALQPLGMPRSAADAAPGASGALLAGKYQLARRIGGEVYEAFDHALGRRVAIKRACGGSVSEDDRRRRIEEARRAAATDHPGIVSTYEIVEVGRDVFVVYEYVEGKTLQQLLSQQRKLAPEQALELLTPVCEALQFAHDRGLVHRDLKPSHMMVGNDGRVKLMDFGAAEGTPEYAGPECTGGGTCPQSDVFSLGVCLYEMLTGSLPFADAPGLDALKVGMDFERPSTKAPNLSRAMDAVVAQALQPSPALRVKSPMAFLKLLAAASGKETAPTTRPGH
ncbi:MAG: protein kinase [Proteobacteria bacterium]|nr:protein kinase [Pseudomonadota bacterium]